MIFKENIISLFYILRLFLSPKPVKIVFWKYGFETHHTCVTTQHVWIVLHHCFLSLSHKQKDSLTPASVSYLSSWVTPKSLLCFCVVSGLTGTWCAVYSCQRRIVTCLWVGRFQSLEKIQYFTLNSRNTKKSSNSLQTAIFKCVLICLVKHACIDLMRLYDMIYRIIWTTVFFFSIFT